MSDDKHQSNQGYELRSFGRRRGRRRSARQDTIFNDGLARWGLDIETEALPPLEQLFAFTPREVWLEIGFGGGEHLIWQAEHNPEIAFIAAEPFEDGVVKVLTAIEEKQLQNIRVYPGDVRQLLRTMAPQSVSRAFILFPDPWPKARHAKRRLVSPALLSALSHVLAPGAELRIATDISSYAAEILAAVHHHEAFGWDVERPHDWRNRPSDWPETRYEAKAIQAQRRPNFFRFRHLRIGKPKSNL